jgi:hypothetical protein
MPSMANRDKSEEIPSDFASAQTLLKSLIESRQFRKEKLEEKATSAAIQILAEAVKDEGAGERRLTAVSMLGKAGEISKPVANVVHRVLEAGLHSVLPAVGAWGNADDRYYLAKGVSVSHSPWVKQYAAEELARAEVNEKLSRAAWADLAVNRAGSLAEVLQIVERSLSGQLDTLSDPTDTAYRKLTRISEALSGSLLGADVPTGQDFGKAFSNLVMLAGGRRGSESIKLREEAALKILELLIQILRFRFEALFDSDLYRAAGSVRGWWRPAQPPNMVEKKSDRIAELAFSGLHVLARQGVADRELRQALVAALGQQRVNIIGKEVSADDPSLDPALSHWLTTGQTLPDAKSNDAVRELNEHVVDELVARLLLAIDNEDGGPLPLKTVAESLELFEPTQASIIRAAAARSELIVQWVKALASKRRLSTYGVRGELVKYDPALHEGPTDFKRLSMARVSVPGITRQLEALPPRIVMKAIVDAP